MAASLDNAETRVNPRVNLGTGARVLSIALGTALVCRAVGGAVVGPLALSLGGAILMWRGFSGACPVKAGLRPRRGAPGARGRHDAADPVHRASEDSFPASDPPSWTPTNGSLRPH